MVYLVMVAFRFYHAGGRSHRGVARLLHGCNYEAVIGLIIAGVVAFTGRATFLRANFSAPFSQKYAIGLT